MIAFLRRRTPRSLTGQLMLSLLIAMVLAQAIALVILADERREALETVKRDQVVGRTAAIVRVLNETPSEYAERVLRAANTRQLQFEVADESALDVNQSEHSQNRFAERLRRLLGYTGEEVVLVRVKRRDWNYDYDHHHDDDHDDDDPWDRDDNHHWHGHGPAITAALLLENGRWLNVTYHVARQPGTWAFATLIIIGFTGISVCGATYFMVRRITRPLSDMAQAADALGRGESGPPLNETGPVEIRTTTAAFNQMRERLGRFVADRTRMLAAISHDLRTPLTALRLRVELLPEDENKARMLAVLDEMQHMTEATLAFARDDAAQEATRNTDLGALLGSIVTDAADRGAAIKLEAEAIPPCRCRPVALKRALRNLVDNAVRYGENTLVTLSADKTDSDIIITIEDDGPGIPDEEMDNVFEPFYRLDPSRNTESGGIGLGLAIARTIIQAHGGTIELGSRSPSGLRIAIRLPVNSTL